MQIEIYSACGKYGNGLGYIWQCFFIHLNFEMPTVCVPCYEIESNQPILSRRVLLNASTCLHNYLHTTSSGLYMDKAMIELTMSLSFSFKALIALFLETLACDITSSISLSSIPSASTGSPSSSSSSFLSSPVSMALPLSAEWLWEWSWPEWSCPA